ncbi:unnamed protein product [Polarella glacialis]|uniref:Solute-binding protein family 3/N-terminal domain-containing protein n=1 Tax=Polarella glacialis TaxID=89957 RepID=A0A813FGZ3_POLGL|nr:unnamed protein product [Polarella glacialis]
MAAAASDESDGFVLRGVSSPPGICRPRGQLSRRPDILSTGMRRAWVAVAAASWLSYQAEAKGGATGVGSSSAPSVSVDPSSQAANVAIYQVPFLMSGDRPPFSLFHPAQGMMGFDHDLLDAVCTAAALDCPQVLGPHTEAWASDPKGYMGAGLRRGDFSCASSSGNAVARKAGLIFSYPYTQPEAGLLFARAAVNWTGVAGKLVGVVLGSSCDAQAVRTHLPSAREPISFADGRSLMQNLRDSTIDAALLCGDEYATRLADNRTAVVKRIEHVSEGLSFMCHPKNVLQVELLNMGLQLVRIQDSGAFLTSLCDRWNVSCEFTRSPAPDGTETESVPSISRSAPSPGPVKQLLTRLLLTSLAATFSCSKRY